MTAKPNKTINIITDSVIWLDQINNLRTINNYNVILLTKHEELNKHNFEEIDLFLILNIKTRLYILNKYNLSSLIYKLGSAQSIKMEDKFICHIWFHKHGLSNLLPKSKKLDDYPFILKTNSSMSGQDVHYVKTKEDLAKIQFNINEYITQEYIHSCYEYAYHFIAINGKTIIDTCYQHDFNSKLQQTTHYIRGSGCHNTKISKFELPNSIKLSFEKIIKKLNYTSIGCIDFKLVNNKLFILEINSRMGGSLLFYNSYVHEFDLFVDCLLSLGHPNNSLAVAQ